MIKNLFPVPVYQNIITSSVDLKSACLKIMNDEKSEQRSNRGGYQSSNIVDHKDFKKLKFSIEFAANKFAKNIGLKDNLKCDTLWININGYKDYNVLHSHPKCVFSGVYYISVPENSGRLEFYSPNFEGIEYDWNNIVEKNLANSSIINFSLKDNLLILFPSFIKHMVEPNMNETEKRISVAFNLAAGV